MEQPATETLETKTSIEADGLNKSLTILGQLHDLIASCLDILEDAEDLLEDCCYDYQALLTLFPADSQKTLTYLIDPMFLNWYSAHKNHSSLNKIIFFTDTIKEGKIVHALHFVLTLKNEYASIFKENTTSFVALQTVHELILRFENSFESKCAFFSQEIDTLILWLTENKASIQNSKNIVLLSSTDEDDEDLHQQASICIDNLFLFIKQLKTCILESMLIHIDEEGRNLGLCPVYEALEADNRGQILYHSYIKSPILKEKMDYLHFLPFLDKGLAVLDQQLRQRIMHTQQIDSGLMLVKRVAYLCQALDPKALFTKGFCIGDSIAWCQKMLQFKDKTIDSATSTLHSRKSLHSEPISDDIYALQMKHQIFNASNDFYCCVPIVNDPESATNFCLSILHLLRAQTLGNNNTLCFTVALTNPLDTDTGHQISVCRFFRANTERFRLRDLNLGEFEADFVELQAWYPSIYATLYGIPSIFIPKPYNHACITIISLKQEPKKTVNPDDMCRLRIQENFYFHQKYAFFSESTLLDNLKIFHAIKTPSLKDTVIYIISALNDVFDKIYSHPNAVITKLDCMLQQMLALQNPDYHFIQNLLEIIFMTALFNDNQIDIFNAKLCNWLSSFNLAALAREDTIILKVIFEQLNNSPLVKYTNELAQQLQKENVLNIMLYCQEKLNECSISIEKLITTLNSLKEYNTRACLKLLAELFKAFSSRMAYSIVDEKFFRMAYGIRGGDLQEDAMHPCIIEAMQRFISHNTEQQVVTKNDFSLTPMRLFMPENPIPRPLVFTRIYFSPRSSEYKEEEESKQVVLYKKLAYAPLF